jgi:hypothetical protein
MNEPKFPRPQAVSTSRPGGNTTAEPGTCDGLHLAQPMLPQLEHPPGHGSAASTSQAIAMIAKENRILAKSAKRLMAEVRMLRVAARSLLPSRR